jgi:lysylphosphatidylglycerol synthetase-like protein (DUF2156 family)
MPEGSATPASLSTTTTLTPADRRQLVASFGDHAQAGAMLQPGIQTVSVNGPRGRAFASFTRALGATIVLGEPVGDSAEARADVVSAILDDDRNAIFFQVRPAFAQLLHDGFGLHRTPIGVEPIVDVATFSLRGRRRQSIRTAINHARSMGIVVTELANDDDTEVAAIDAAATAWERTRRRRHIRFLVPPLHHRLPGLTRTFIARQGTDVLGFVTFDALSSDGRVHGYTPSVSRASTRFRAGLWYVLMAHALEQFRIEGVTTVNLGLVPMARGGSSATALTGDDGGPLPPLLRLLRNVGVPVYPFAGIEHAKGRFGGQAVMSYLAHRHPLPLVALLGTLWRTVTGP